MHQERLKKVYDRLASSGLQQTIITEPASIFYLTGKWFDPGKRLLALYLNQHAQKNRLVVNSLFTVPEDLGVEKLWFDDTQNGAALLAKCAEEDKPLGIDKSMAAGFLLQLMEQKAASAYVNASACVDAVRQRKDSDEAERMRRASAINDQTMAKVLGYIKEGAVEDELAQAVLRIHKELGADGPSFEPLIGFGANAAIGHYAAGSTMLKAGDCVLVDIGCKKDGYCADMTRTFFYRSVSEQMRRVYETVKAAGEAAMGIIRPGVRFCDIDNAARSLIEKAGYGAYFTHRLGHSIGIEVHEAGDVSAANTAPVEPGMTFSVEPGIYLPGAGGVRIENLVLVMEGGCEVLNHAPRDLEVLE